MGEADLFKRERVVLWGIRRAGRSHSDICGLPFWSLKFVSQVKMELAENRGNYACLYGGYSPIKKPHPLLPLNRDVILKLDIMQVVCRNFRAKAGTWVEFRRQIQVIAGVDKVAFAPFRQSRCKDFTWNECRRRGDMQNKNTAKV